MNGCFSLLFECKGSNLEINELVLLPSASPLEQNLDNLASMYALALGICG